MNVTKELMDTLCGLFHAELDENGSELLNPTPVNTNIELEKPLSMQEQIERLMKGKLSQQAWLQGEETFEEANDFDVDDEFINEPLSGYEVQELEEEYITTQPNAPESSEPSTEVPTEVSEETAADNSAASEPPAA